MNVPATPECDRWAEVSEQGNVLLDFLQYLKERGLTLCREAETWQGGFHPAGIPDVKLIYRYFDIDPEQLEDERQAMLKFLRTRNAP
mgnify:CR=1 FL=1